MLAPARPRSRISRSALIALLPFPVFGLAIVVMAVPEWQAFRESIHRENGPIELPTFAAFLVSAAWGALIGYRFWKHLRDGVAAGVCFAFAFGCFFVAGEEIAWGQWFFGFETPEAWASINLQQETTLHNLPGLQGKSEALRLVFGVGGMIGVALSCVPRFAAVAAPPMLLTWFALIAAFAGGELLTDYVVLPVELVHKGLQAKFFSEYQELVISVTALIYLSAVSGRLPRDRAVSATAPAE